MFLDVSAEPGKAWHLEVFAGNDRVLSRLIEGTNGERSPRRIQVGLEAFSGATLQLRIYQRTLVGSRLPSPAYWHKLEVR